MKKLAVGLAIVLASAGLAFPTTHAGPVPPATKRHVTDPALLAQMAQARARSGRTQAVGFPALVTAEVLTDDTVGVTRQIALLGGRVTGDVPGSLVQATIPVDLADAVASIAPVTDVRAVRRAGYVPTGSQLVRTDSTPRPQATNGFGSTHGSEVASTNAVQWHLGGVTGAGVKVGIIDYFDFSAAIWTADRQGPVPDAAHQFCLDTSLQVPSLCSASLIISGPDNSDFVHGSAVAEIVKDMAPGAELYVASVGTVSDLTAAIDFFAANNVHIVTRSLGAAFDGPGDGTNSPLDAVVDYAVSKGITWFNSVGNDGVDQATGLGSYIRRTVPTSLAPGSYVNFNDQRLLTDLFNNPGPYPDPDTWLQVVSIPGQCYYLDGVRWAYDWGQATPTDYSVEVYEPTTTPVAAHDNPATFTPINVFDASQATGARPLEGADQPICPHNQLSATYFTDTARTNPAAVSYIRVKLNAGSSVGVTADTLEIGIAGAGAGFETEYGDTASSAAHPVSESANLGLVAVGAVDMVPTNRANPADPNSIAYYSSQGPTNDGRIKPDLSAPSGFVSDVYSTADGVPGTTFSGTSSASPTAAGAAALVLGAGLAAPGVPLATLMKSYTVDLGSPGADNAYGAGLLRLPVKPSRFISLPSAQRILDTRITDHVGPTNLVGPYPRKAVINVDVKTLLGGGTLTAVALNVTSVNSLAQGYLNVFPKGGAPFSTSTLNVTYVGAPRPNFAIVPVSSDGQISVAFQAGGDVILDVEGYFTNDTAPPVAEGRFVALATPERWLDTRGGSNAPLPASFGGAARKVNARETIDVPRKPGTMVPLTSGAGQQVSALVVNITTVNGDRNGFARAFPSGITTTLNSSNINFLGGRQATANTAIVNVGSTNGLISVWPNVRVDMLVDVVGYITSAGAPTATTGMFLPVTPTRVYDTRVTDGIFAGLQQRTLSVDGGSSGVEAAAVQLGAMSTNLTVTGNPGFGYLSAYPGALQSLPSTSNVNWAPNETVANAALLGVNTGGATDTVTVFMQTPGHVIIDINGYFLR